MPIRRVPAVSAEQENFRLERLMPGDDRFSSIRRDPVEPVPQGTIVVKAFRVTGYDQDCDGSLMARIENIDADGEPTGWRETHLGLYSNSTWMVDSISDLDNDPEGLKAQVFRSDGPEPPPGVMALEWLNHSNPTDFRYLRRDGTGWLWSHSVTQQIPDVRATPNDWVAAVRTCPGEYREVTTSENTGSSAE